ncbi:hypothetical protein AAW01_02070 [Aurantiacibacter gangjinensis]|uniref:DUF1508 domain-containing protein n=1 Tax=Aurantiacibacter gangjinensis TaxID=502682 RepID=A0A0G9MQ46_9SPHN|nr:hypothetical protein AAW01_02070 [Aurantiacibacter gangjinensis]
MRGHHFEIFKDKAGEFRARFKYNNEIIFATEGYTNEASAKNAIESIVKNGPSAQRQFRDAPELERIQHAIDSTDWTGLGKAITRQKAVVIREKTDALLQAIIQSDADMETRTDACKRVEAAIVLLEAPNVPWREVVGLLNHPTVTAFLAALNLLQFIIGLA